MSLVKMTLRMTVKMPLVTEAARHPPGAAVRVSAAGGAPPPGLLLPPPQRWPGTILREKIG